MKLFDMNYMLKSDTARTLYHEYCEDLPIIDYHCHISPQMIAENCCFSDITELWLGGDHYKWRLMREHGVPEYYITGDASSKEKFERWMEVLEVAVGNPIYQWSKMELSRYFGWDGPLLAELSGDIWNQCERIIKEKHMTPRSVIQESGVRILCTTDDPVDDLRWHHLIREDKDFSTQVLPAFRPDCIIQCNDIGFIDYLEKLERITETKIREYDDLLSAIEVRMEYFDSMGCVVSDHGLDDIPFAMADLKEIREIFRKIRIGNRLTALENEKYQTRILLDLAERYADRNWVFQLHYGAKRNVNHRRFRQLGPDSGFDCINGRTLGEKLPEFLNALAESDIMPKTIIYSLRQSDNQYIDSVINCFQVDGKHSWLQHGAAWWFNDNLHGIREQLQSRASMGMLTDFIGMLTDSRSFISYSRHDYFRRVLCQLLADWIEADLFDNNISLAGEIAQKISLYNVAEYFNWEV